jgi:hypothetical protein
MMGSEARVTNLRQALGPLLSCVFGRERKTKNHLIFLKSQWDEGGSPPSL